MRGPKELVDFQGYKDACYTLLAIGSFVVCLGLYSPYNYIRECRKFPFPPYTDIFPKESYAAQWDVPPSVHDNLLAIMNGVSVIGRIGSVNVVYRRCLANEEILQRRANWR